MRRRGRFLDYFLRGGPSPALLGVFFFGLLAVGLLTDMVYDLLTAPVGSLPVAWRPFVAAAVLAAVAYALYRWDSRERKGEMEFDESRLASPHLGLIWLFGPGRFGHFLVALERHRQGGGAAHCWLVMQDVGPVQENFARLQQRLLEDGVATRLHRVYIPKLEVQAAYEAVQTVFQREAEEKGLRPDQVIADITGGTKPMTAGMLLAALTTGGALEYVESERDADGNPIPGTEHVVSVDIAFYLT